MTSSTSLWGRDVSKVTNMEYMFQYASRFNQTLKTVGRVSE